MDCVGCGGSGKDVGLEECCLSLDKLAENVLVEHMLGRSVLGAKCRRVNQQAYVDTCSIASSRSLGAEFKLQCNWTFTIKFG